LAAARSLVAAYPLDERGHARVAQALERNGRAAEAHAYIEDARQRLSHQLGLPIAKCLAERPEEPGAAKAECTRLPAVHVAVSSPLRCHQVKRPLLAISPLGFAPEGEAQKAIALYAAATLTDLLWRNGVCDLTEAEQSASHEIAPPPASYVVRGALTQIESGLHLALRCEDVNAASLIWSGRFGPDRQSGKQLNSWTMHAAGAIPAAIQTAEMRRARQENAEQDVHGLLLRALAQASALEPLANRSALALLGKALTEAPDEPRALALAAWCHAQRCVYNWSDAAEGDRGHAARLAKEAACLGHDDPSCLTFLAAAHSLVGDHRSAAALLGQALQINPHAAWTQTRGGYLALYHDQPTRAARHFRAALRLAPLDPASFNSMAGLGIAQHLLGEHDQAITWMERALALNPRAVWIQRNLVPAYIAARRQADAERGLQTLLAAHPKLSVTAVCDALVFSRPTMNRIADGLTRAGLPRT
jgi:tetratricopeptide (TPR) repeat protein